MWRGNIPGRFAFAAVVLAAAIAGCGGGGGGGGSVTPPGSTPTPVGTGTPTATPNGTATPTATPTATATPAATATPGGTPTPTPMSTTSAYAGSPITLFIGSNSIIVPGSAAAPPAGTTVTVVMNVVPETGFPVLQSVRRLLSSQWSGLNPQYYVTVTFNNTVTLTAQPSLTVQFASRPSTPEYLAFYDPTSSVWTMDVAGQATISGTYVIFPAQPGNHVYVGGTVYDFVIYGNPGATPSPTPIPTPTPTASPTPTATPTPSPTPTATPTPSPSPNPQAGRMVITPSGQLPVTPAGHNTFLIQDYNADGSPYTGAFVKTSDTCTNYTAPTDTKARTYATTDFTAGAHGPALTVTVTGGNDGGNCVLIFADQLSPAHSAFVNIVNYGGTISPH
jgi:hypothetical protein